MASQLKAQRLAQPVLLPRPRAMTLTGGTLRLTEDRLILVQHPTSANAVQFQFIEAQCALKEFGKVHWQIYAGKGAPEDKVGLRLIVAPSSQTLSALDRQSYRLSIDANGIAIEAPAEQGLLYGVMTLMQLLKQYGPTLPCLQIEDRPDFAVRGLMLDVSRGKVPTMKTMRELINMLVGLKINQLQLYIEHTFAFQNHPVIWQKASPFTGEEILELDAYCRECHIDLVPNQQCFGHMTKWLIHPEYRDLAEAPDGCDTRWGHYNDPIGLNPTDPRSLQLVREMFDEVLPHYRSGMVNVGGDETIDLGLGRSKAECEARGTGRVYLDFILKIYDVIKSHGKQMQFWGDVIMEHPELVPELPKDLIALEWGYEFDHPFAEHGKHFAASGIPFYVCPGTGVWNSLGGRTANAMGNLLNAAENGMKHGAVGYLMTDWGDRGYLQPLPTSFLGYGYGAAVSWSLEANRDLDIAQAISLHLFDDASGKTGQFVYEVGNIYKLVPERMHNGTAYSYGLTLSEAHFKQYNTLLNLQINTKSVKPVLKEIARLEKQLPKLKMGRTDAKLIQQEYGFVFDAARYGMSRIERLVKGQTPADMKATKATVRQLKADLKKVWLARYRPGGLEESSENIRI